MGLERMLIKDMQCPDELCSEHNTIIEWTPQFPVKYCVICGKELVDL